MSELNIYSGGRWVAVSGGTGGDSAITVHDGSIPNPAEETPKGLEDSLAAYADGLHYFKATGSLLAITRQQYQTDITLTGPVSSVAKIVKSEAGLPTPQNPSLIVIKSVDGQWIKMVSDELDKPFGNPSRVDLFNLGTVDLSAYAKLTDATQVLTARTLTCRGVSYQQVLGGNATGTLSLNDLNNGNGVRLGVSLDGKEPTQLAWLTDLNSYYTKEETSVEIDAYFQNSVNNLTVVTQALDGAIATKADKADTYTKTESDRKFLDYQYFNDNAYYGPSVTFKDTFGTVRWKTTNYGTGPDAILSISGWGDPNVPNSPVVPRLYFEATNEIGGYLAYADDTYTKTEIDTIVSENGQEHQAIESLVRELGVTVGDSLALKADVATTYTKPEVDEAIAASISGQLSPAQIEELVSQVGPVDLTAYAKKEDASQNVIANAFVGQGFVFGTQVAGSNPGLVYLDTNEGYGPRLVLATPGGNELIPYQSDFEPIKARMEALESKQAVGVDAAAAAEAIQKVDLLGMEVGLSASACKNTAEKVQELEARITAINPIGSADINDPSLAAFKKSVLDEVKKMMAGGKDIPADVPWTKLLNAGNAPNAPEAKVLNGIVYMRGEAVKQGGAGYSANAYQLPPTIPAPPREMVVPLAMKNTNPSGRYYGYATIQTNRQIGVSSDNSFNTVWFDGISYPAYE